MPRYILFSFCLIFFFSNNVQAYFSYGTADTSSGYCNLTSFKFGQVKWEKKNMITQRCELATCTEGHYKLTGVWKYQTLTRIVVTYSWNLEQTSITLTAVL
uniref:U13-Sparatoxin-Hju1r_1 n=1 Tax=Heteropoda jugulans TaxID=1358901 RepID=A0A4Q8KCH2_9ARAC